MHMADFKKTVAITFDLEDKGEVTNTPGDKGGLTKWGISAAAYPNVDIRNLTREGAEALYKADYWNIGKNDYLSQLPFPVAFLLFDWRVTSSPKPVYKTFQSTCGLVGAKNVDGIFGGGTLAAFMNKVKLDRPGAEDRVRDFCIEFTEARAQYYKSLNDPKFDNGWRNRAIRALGHAFYNWQR